MPVSRVLFSFFAAFAIAVSASGELPASDSVDAVVSGETYLGVSGRSATIRFGEQVCALFSSGDPGKDFTISLKCGGRVQVLWDKAQEERDGVAFDDPKFALEWAGDKDGDGRLDLVMELSPKYSCTRQVTFLSTKATAGELVGISGSVRLVCGD